MRVKKLSARVMTALVASGVLLITPISPAQAAGAITDNGNGSITVSGVSPSGDMLFVCATSITALNCKSNAAYLYVIEFDGTYSASQGFTRANGSNMRNTLLPAGTYNMAISPFNGSVVAGTDLSNVVIAQGSSTPTVETPPAPVENTLTLALAASGATCTVGDPVGIQGTWLRLPATDECSQSGPNAKTDADLLGWSTSANFPAARAQAQINNSWGVIDEEIEGIRMIFIPAGMSTFVSGDNNLYPIWNK
jgi:hypothetical protein